MIWSDLAQRASGYRRSTQAASEFYVDILIGWDMIIGLRFMTPMIRRQS